PPTPPSELVKISTSTAKPKQQYPLQCTTKSLNQTCPYNYPTNYSSTNNPGRPSTCPDYFHWIHEDLRPWKETGITRQMIEGARRTANFRLVILHGRVYVEKYRESLQTRDEFTLWGILQLLRRYPGRLPDLELLFDCDDRPVIPAKNFRRPNSGPPPLFKYCSDPWSLDIVFPDWSFWGWPECNIKLWRNASKDVQEGSKSIKWKDRVPYVYWRGSPNVAPWRADFLKCNATNNAEWNVRLYAQNWEKQAEVGYKESDLKGQCTHRYKIYIEGWAWSVSEKYILGCDSMTLVVKPKYHDFSIEGCCHWCIIGPLETMINANLSNMKMEYVYDYMFHLLNEYAKLLKFKPVIPPKAVELCSEAMACEAEGKWRMFMEESLELSPSNGLSCTLSPPYDPLALRSFLDKEANLTKQVEMWEDKYWEKLNPRRK
ncbi:O-glucosyltransferase rumi, partial [Bienertia sinuspersici]